MTFYLNNESSSFALRLGMNILGRLNSSDIQIKDPHVSRKHLSIDLLADNSCTLMDLGSSNGLFVGGKKVPSAILSEGESFLVGKTHLTISKQKL